jgi:hypothetical protein
MRGMSGGRMRAVRSCFRLFVVGYSNGSVNCRTSGLEDKGGMDLWRSEERNKNANGRGQPRSTVELHNDTILDISTQPKKPKKKTPPDAKQKWQHTSG